MKIPMPGSHRPCVAADLAPHRDGRGVKSVGQNLALAIHSGTAKMPKNMYNFKIIHLELLVF